MFPNSLTSQINSYYKALTLEPKSTTKHECYRSGVLFKAPEKFKIPLLYSHIGLLFRHKYQNLVVIQIFKLHGQKNLESWKFLN